MKFGYFLLGFVAVSKGVVVFRDDVVFKIPDVDFNLARPRLYNLDSLKLHSATSIEPRPPLNCGYLLNSA